MNHLLIALIGLFTGLGLGFALYLLTLRILYGGKPKEYD